MVVECQIQPTTWRRSIKSGFAVLMSYCLLWNDYHQRVKRKTTDDPLYSALDDVCCCILRCLSQTRRMVSNVCVCMCGGGRGNQTLEYVCVCCWPNTRVSCLASRCCYRLTRVDDTTHPHPATLSLPPSLPPSVRPPSPSPSFLPLSQYLMLYMLYLFKLS